MKNKSLRVLLSAPGFFPHISGGGQVYVYRLTKELLKRNHEVTIITSAPWNEENGANCIDSYTYENIPVVSFRLNPKEVSYKESQLGFGPLTSKFLYKFLNECRPDIVHINGIKPAFTSLCNELNISHLITAHHAGIICPAGTLVKEDGSICDRAANTTDCVPCCNFWRRPKWYTGGMLGKIPAFIYRRIGKKLNDSKKLSYIERGLIYSYLVEQSIETKKMMIEQAQHYIAPSRAMHDLLIRNGCDPKKITIIPHGIELLKKLPIEKFDGRPVRFGYVGRVDRLKGLHVLLEALELLPDGKTCELHIFGAARNPWDQEYFEKTLNLYKGKSKVFKHGFISHERLIEVYSIIDVLVIPSLLPEAFGLVVAEAFSAGRPVILFNSGGLAEQVTDGVSGFVVKSFDKYSLAEVIQMVVNNPNIITEMSSRSPNVKTTAEHAGEIETIYRELFLPAP